MYRRVVLVKVWVEMWEVLVAVLVFVRMLKVQILVVLCILLVNNDFCSTFGSNNESSQPKHRRWIYNCVLCLGLGLVLRD